MRSGLRRAMDICVGQLLDSLQLPGILARLCDHHQGMVLVTGSTGTGKSTTLTLILFNKTWFHTNTWRNRHNSGRSSRY